MVIRDILTDSPGSVISDNYNKYKWHSKIRIVLQNGKIIGPINYNGNETIFIKKKEYEFPNCFYNKKTKKLNCSFYDIVPDKVLLINDYTYRYMKNHKLFNKVKKNNNLYDKLLEFSKKKRNTKIQDLVNEQDLFIESPDFRYDIVTEEELKDIEKTRYIGSTIRKKDRGTLKQRKKDGWSKTKSGWIYKKGIIIEGKNDWAFLNPKKNFSSKNRINKIVDRFLRFCLDKKISKKHKIY